jgi:hypothetical protein
MFSYDPFPGAALIEMAAGDTTVGPTPKTRIVQIARAWIGWGRVEGYRRLRRFSTVD